MLTTRWLILLVVAACKHGSAAPLTVVDAGVPDVGLPAGDADALVLGENWRLAPAVDVQEGGAAISTPGFAVADWLPGEVPTTVLAALVAAGREVDPFSFDGLEKIAPITGSWWYRTEFIVPAADPQAFFLAVEGVNYRAEVWLNGVRLDAGEVVGTFTRHEWKVSERIRVGEANALAIQVFPPDRATDLALNWHDWNPTPPDRNLGVWQDVILRRSGAVAVRDTHVRSRLEGGKATLTIDSDVVNTTDQAQAAVVHARFDGQELSAAVELAPGERRRVSFTPVVDRPRLWWPAELGRPELYSLQVTAEVGGEVSDLEAVRFGIREVSFELLEEGVRLFRINGERVFIRGGGWASDMLLRPASPARLAAELRYTLELGLNTIRLEGKLERDAFYDRADELGLLLLPGWMCCDRWERWDEWGAADHAIASASMESQARRLRNHPSVIAFMIASDYAPPGDVELEYLDALERADWSVPVMPSASRDDGELLGDSGVKMTGPYEWVAPIYWYEDVERGGAFGFNSETGPGPAIPELESLRAMLSEAELEDLWREPGQRLLHAGTGGTPFDSLEIFHEALAARHGAPDSLEDFVRKAQLMNYEAERVMYEAYARQKYASTTGLVHWLLNNAWPSLIWHLYGHDLVPAGGYFGARKANEPLHIQYSYDDRSIVVVNQTRQVENDLTARARVVELGGEVGFDEELEVDLAADASLRLFDVPEGEGETYFLALELRRGDVILGHNFYWLSRRAEIVDHERSTFFHSPTEQFADFTALDELGEAEVDVQVEHEDGLVRVSLSNPGGTPAFFLRVMLKRAGQPVAPVYWSDNYISLLAGESRELEARHDGDAPTVELSGWNVASQVVR